MPEPIRLADYRPPAFAVTAVDLRVELDPDATRVRSRLQVRRQGDGDLVLNGCQLRLLALRVDGRTLGAADYTIDGEALTLPGLADTAEIEVETEIAPAANSALEGLYLSSGMYCTQCEAEGFRRITWYPDRPDVMARYTTTVVADPATCPVLLSNGNRVEAGRLDDGRHWVRWEDPYLKPSYLFALVAGDLACVRDTFTTRSGRAIALELYVQHHNADKCAHALAALQKAMTWDEEKYGREYDLDTYMIVAVDDFNMGAMENKGLNVFNSAAVLARPETATDADFLRIESIVAHEYFHNWTGNRVTCRDWFQLSLKEGLTVFRDQQFSADTYSPAVQRIHDVNLLRTYQFAEDAGPMAHPVRPEQYIEINNFYTMTVYNKGAEVIRMLHTRLGAAGFRRGMDRYFERYDGQAVTVEDFVAALGDANATDLTPFLAWYRQAGTPIVTVGEQWDGAAGRYTLTLEQRCPPTPGQPDKVPLPIPVALGLLGGDGRELPLQLAGETAPHPETTRVVELDGARREFTFVGLEERPVPSLLRGFSAPVRLDFPDRATQLPLLMAHDPDPFNRWDAAQQWALGLLQQLAGDWRAGRPLQLPEPFRDGFAATLAADLDPALAALALNLPSEVYLAEQATAEIDPDALHAARTWLRGALAEALADAWRATYERLDGRRAYRLVAAEVGRRALKNLALGYLMERPDAAGVARCRDQLEQADNLTDALAALGALANADVPERQPALDAFRARWRDDPLVLDKWLSLQATARLPGTLDRVKALMHDPAFSLRNPNRVRALVGAFCHGNPAQFHAADGAGYAFLGEQVRTLNASNPQLAARLLGAFGQWRRYDPARQARVEEELEAILKLPELSRDLFEVATKLLAAPARSPR
jgi:aminopeptidase N